MTDWTRQELERIGRAEELEIASRRPDGSLRPFVTIWAVRAGDGVFGRSAYGPDNGWYRRALQSGTGRIRAGGIERDVGSTRPPPRTRRRSLPRTTRSTAGAAPACAGEWPRLLPPPDLSPKEKVPLQRPTT